MSRRVYKSDIPVHAVEVVKKRHDDGTKKHASYFIGDEQVGHRMWDEHGQLEYEFAMRGGVKHGHQYEFGANGHLFSKETYHHGKLHGTGWQWSADGRVLVQWKLVDNVGLDLWCDSDTETLAEEHYWPREGELGQKRQWNSDEKTVSEEYFYVLGKGIHGIWREWNSHGKLRRGFPHYYVNDARVTKRQYLRACGSDPTLPLYRAEDDRPHRKLPAEYLAQRQK